jgi:hypothetical protein
MHAEEIIPIFLISNIYVGLCLPTALTLTRLGLYEILEVMLIVRINKSVVLWGILNFPQLRDVFLYCPMRGIPLMAGVL